MGLPVLYKLPSCSASVADAAVLGKAKADAALAEEERSVSQAGSESTEAGTSQNRPSTGELLVRTQRTCSSARHAPAYAAVLCAGFPLLEHE